MTQDPTRNQQSGVPVAQSTAGAGVVASADRRDGVHYEADPDQIVKVVHQVTPDTVAVQGPSDYGRRGGPHETADTEVAVTPETASVWEARRGQRDEPKRYANEADGQALP